MTLVALTGLVAGLGLYFFPTIIAAARHKTNAIAIFLINLLLGWSIIGWVIALVWAVSTDAVDTAKVAQTTTSKPASDRRCPYCAEPIQSAAIVCRHCGRDLPPAPVVAAPVEVAGVVATTDRSLRTAGLLFAGVIGAAIIGIAVFGSYATSPATPPGQQKPYQPVASLSTPSTTPPTKTASTPPRPTDKWTLGHRKDPMNDQAVIAASLDAENEIQGWLTHETPELVVRCQTPSVKTYGRTAEHPGLEVYVRLGMSAQVESGDTRTVSVRFDDGNAQTMYWGKSTDDKALFAQGDDIETIFAGLRSAKRLLFQVTPFNSSPAVAKFDVHGFERHVADLLTACKARG